MSKFVMAITILCLLSLIIVGAFVPDSPTMWLASTSLSFSILRGALIVLLAALLITKPPRNTYFRLFVGLVSISLFSWTINSTLNYQMGFLDALLLLEVSITTAIFALEVKTDKPVIIRVSNSKLKPVNI